MEEWTRAEIGVGAAIAAGSHALKGNWALFVMAAVKMRMEENDEKCLLRGNSHDIRNEIVLIERMIAISPIRLERIVSVPDSLDL